MTRESPPAAVDFKIAGHGAMQIAATREGPAHGFPVCLIHGGGQTRHAWRAAQRSLAEKGFLAVSLDLRGHGESSWSATAAYRYDDYAADLRCVAETLPRPPILVGASLGGIASVLAAGEKPPIAIAGLVLVDVAANMRKEGSRAIMDFMLGTTGGFDNLEAAADAVARYLPHRPRPRNTDGLMKNLRKHENGRFIWHWDPRAFTQSFDSEALSRRLEGAAALIDVPAILLRGEASELVTREIADAFMKLFHQGAVVDIPKAHHMVAGDRNDAFNAELLAFVTAIRAAQAHAYAQRSTGRCAG